MDCRGRDVPVRSQRRSGTPYASCGWLRDAARCRRVLAPGRQMRRRGSLEAMSTVDVSAEALDAARREAERRGVDVSVVISEAIQRFVVAADLGELLEIGRAHV